ncbi:hypothetical protein ACFLYO_02910 [Chloroflexota bacterium]
MSDDLYGRIIDERGSFPNLLSRIPLLGDNIESYFDMSAQRDADRIIREHVAGLLRQEINRFAGAENIILDNGGLKVMSKTRSVKQMLQTLADRIGTAAPGYAFSGALKVGQDELADIYAFDEAMLRYAEQISVSVDGLIAAANANDGIDEALTTLRGVIIEADQAFSLRKNVINGLV